MAMAPDFAGLQNAEKGWPQENDKTGLGHSPLQQNLSLPQLCMHDDERTTYEYLKKTNQLQCARKISLKEPVS